MKPRLHFDPAAAHFDRDGLLACIVQSTTGEVRMLGYMTQESLVQTIDSGRVTFFSRSRQKIWVKGESSGHFLLARDLHLDCDGDAILVVAECVGPTCHRGTLSCFAHDDAPVSPGNSLGFLTELEAQLLTKKATARVDGSYTERLFFLGTDRIAKKVVEEAGEVILAAKNLDAKPDAITRELFVGEAADLLFHLELLLLKEQVTLADVAQELDRRHRARGNSAEVSDSREK
jgi:phosphoribosyl-ATP pyrophosphohydrolase/phosphoribosyl-AMP cyclohydrolase